MSIQWLALVSWASHISSLFFSKPPRIHTEKIGSSPLASYHLLTTDFPEPVLYARTLGKHVTNVLKFDWPRCDVGNGLELACA
jgi:hypothetical protein